MRARNLKPSFFKNETLGAADPLYGIVFQGLWCLADREGRLEDRPRRIHVEVNPYRNPASTVQALDWLVQHRFLIRYESGGDRYLAVANFRRHQQPHIKEAASKIPPPTDQQLSEARCEHGACTEQAALTPDSGFPLPDSGFPLTDSGKHRARTVQARGISEVPRGAFQKIRDVYPAGLARDADWILAERAIRSVLEDGESVATMVAASAAYAMQQQALGNTGTRFVMAPLKFFSEGHWRGPFPTPSKAENALEEIRRLNSHGSAATTQIHPAIDVTPEPEDETNAA